MNDQICISGVGGISNLGAFLEHFTIVHHSLVIHIENYLHVIQNNKVKSLAFSAIRFYL